MNPNGQGSLFMMGGVTMSVPSSSHILMTHPPMMTQALGGVRLPQTSKFPIKQDPMESLATPTTNLYLCSTGNSASLKTSIHYMSSSVHCTVYINLVLSFVHYTMYPLCVSFVHYTMYPLYVSFVHYTMYPLCVSFVHYTMYPLCVFIYPFTSGINIKQEIEERQDKTSVDLLDQAYQSLIQKKIKDSLSSFIASVPGIVPKLSIHPLSIHSSIHCYLSIIIYLSIHSSIYYYSSIHFPTHSSISLFIHPFPYSFIHPLLSIYLSINTFIHPFPYSSIHFPTYSSIHCYLSIYLSIHSSIHFPIHSSISLFIHPLLFLIIIYHFYR